MSGEFAEQLIADLASLVRRMSYQINRDGTNPKLVQQSVEFLKRNGLGGEVLREMGTPAVTRDRNDARAAMAEYDRQLVSARAEVERLREDAERYRWLRDQGHKGGGNFYFRATGEVGRDGLDAAIDAARKEQA